MIHKGKLLISSSLFLEVLKKIISFVSNIDLNNDNNSDVDNIANSVVKNIANFTVSSLPINNQNIILLNFRLADHLCQETVEV